MTVQRAHDYCAQDTVPVLNSVSPFPSLAGQGDQNQCFPNPKNAPTSFRTPGMGVLPTLAACLVAVVEHGPKAPAMAPAHHGTAMSPAPLAQVPSSCNVPYFLLLWARLAHSHPDLSLRVTLWKGL